MGWRSTTNCASSTTLYRSTLIRPALERLRDVAWAGGFQRLYVHSPDRLARKYAWQMLLVEELQRSGVELVFLNHTIGASPRKICFFRCRNDREYERTKFMERSRRGKRHAARSGSVNVLKHAPYGIATSASTKAAGRRNTKLTSSKLRSCGRYSSGSAETV